MSWTVACPHCGKEYNLDVQHQGKKCRCAACQQIFICPEDLEKFTLENTPAAAAIRRVRCPECRQAAPQNADFCPHCGVLLRQPARSANKPFLCGVLNIIGGFAVGLSGLALLAQLIAAGVEFFHPSEHSYIREDTGEFYKSVMIGFAVFFGGMVVLGISQAVARASRRW